MPPLEAPRNSLPPAVTGIRPGVLLFNDISQGHTHARRASDICVELSEEDKTELGDERCRKLIKVDVWDQGSSSRLAVGSAALTDHNLSAKVNMQKLAQKVVNRFKTIGRMDAWKQTYLNRNTVVGNRCVQGNRRREMW